LHGREDREIPLGQDLAFPWVRLVRFQLGHKACAKKHFKEQRNGVTRQAWQTIAL
jgi:hypothetical protein